MKRFTQQVYALGLAHWPWLLLGLAVLAFLMRIHWVFRVLATAILALILISVWIGLVVTLRERGAKASESQSFLKDLRLRIQHAQDQQALLAKELVEIDEKLRQLQALAPKAESERVKSLEQTLEAGYVKEREMRGEKLRFYQESERALCHLEQRWRKAQELQVLQRDLGRLREEGARKGSISEAQMADDLAKEEALLKAYVTFNRNVEVAAEATHVRQQRDAWLDDVKRNA